ncbi:MAG: two-component regulator propeller domain-containing protein [Bacteroidota bacterium]
MTPRYFPSVSYILVIVVLFITACQGQKREQSAAKPSALTKKVVSLPTPGTPPPPQVNPLNDPSLVSQYIRTIFQDSRGTYWFGPAGRSVASYDGDTLMYYSMEAFFAGNDLLDRETGNSVHSTAEDAAGNVWFGTHIGLIKYDGKTFKNYTSNSGLTETNISRNSMLLDQSGQFWVGTQGGLFLYDPEADRKGEPCFSLFGKLPPITVKDIHQDRIGNIWIASGERGVFRYDGSSVQNFTEKDGLSDNYAGGIAEDSKGNIWFTIEAGICRYDGTSFTEFKSEIGIPKYDVWGILIERGTDIVWITARGRTIRFDPSVPLTNPDAYKIFKPEDGLNCCVQSMYQDQEGNVWWGAGEGLFRFDGENFYKVKRDGPW